MVSVAKPWVMCGNHGLNNITMFFFFMAHFHKGLTRCYSSLICIFFIALLNKKMLIQQLTRCMHISKLLWYKMVLSIINSIEQLTEKSQLSIGQHVTSPEICVGNFDILTRNSWTCLEISQSNGTYGCTFSSKYTRAHLFTTSDLSHTWFHILPMMVTHLLLCKYVVLGQIRWMVFW